ncbi:MAG TPA: class I SAM-dependent methyltransferase [Candidatus Omnitrophota bacterium]|nr:class I SAM-dependent methyltransferase [Candidatus Omnitrophota bacterium]
MNNKLFQRFYSGREGWIDGTTQFKRLIESRLRPEFEILDLGAGQESAHNYRGVVRKVTGIDISGNIFSNLSLDEAYKCQVSQMPFKDNQFDLAYADWLLEHLAEPLPAAKEIYRVLKPDGILIIRTPNLWHYIPLLGRLTPFKAHIFLRRFLQDEDEANTFRTYYRLNTISKVKRVFRKAGFIAEELSLVEKEPSYLMKWDWLFTIGLAYERLVNSTESLRRLRANIFAVFRKPIS